MVGKYPNILENLNICDGVIILRLLVMNIRSRAIRKPRVVTHRARSFR